MKPSEPVPSFGKKTKYRGIEFKSQCEARWAALFDIVGDACAKQRRPVTVSDVVREMLRRSAARLDGRALASRRS